jgi:hypothetical protein
VTHAVLCPLRRVILVDVQRSTIDLGPCTACLVGGTSLSSLSLAAHTVVLEQLRESTLALHSPQPPIILDDEQVAAVAMVPYDVSYRGLTADFATVHLPEEHLNSLMEYPDEEQGLLRRRRPQKLLPRGSSSLSAAVRVFLLLFRSSWVLKSLEPVEF